MLGVGADLEEFQALFAPRIEELERQFIAPLDELGEAIARAERELQEPAASPRREGRGGLGQVQAGVRTLPARGIRHRGRRRRTARSTGARASRRHLPVKVEEASL